MLFMAAPSWIRVANAFLRWSIKHLAEIFSKPEKLIDSLKNNLELLCSFGPRGSGYPADKKAAEYFSATMKSCGFSIREESFTGPHFKDEGSYIEAGQEKIAAKAYLYSTGTRENTVEGEMVFAHLSKPVEEIRCDGKIVILTMSEDYLKKIILSPR